MRSLDLVTLAAQAEGLRWRREASGAARRVALIATAAGFGIVAVVLLHVAGWWALADRFSPVTASLGIAVVDLMLAMALLLLARRRPDAVAIEALRVRRLAIARLDGQSLIDDGMRSLGWRAPALAIGGVFIDRLVKALLRR